LKPIREIIEERNLKPAELAHGVGLGYSTIANWLAGKTRLSPASLKKVAEYLVIDEKDIENPQPKKWADENVSERFTESDRASKKALEFLLAEMDPLELKKLVALALDRDCMDLLGELSKFKRTAKSGSKGQ
jgi:transcriptional regulator with XRE-family HTH domain